MDSVKITLVFNIKNTLYKHRLIIKKFLYPHSQIVKLMSSVAKYLTEDEYIKGRTILKFLSKISHNKRYIPISQEELVKVTSALLEIDPYQAYMLLRKLQAMGKINFDMDGVWIIGSL